MNSSAIAIIGMAGRFPGARNVFEFWQNLRDGVESIRDRSDAELLAVGVTPEELASPDYVKRAALLDDMPMFDASFFGFSPRDASIMDPQHRHFLECAWEALEDAGHSPHPFDGSIGVFAGSGLNTYLIHNLLANRRLIESAGLFQLKQTGNDKDVLATRVSYQLDLRGPSINVQTACSTSLVAVHLACQSLLNHECDMALAGGVTIEIPHGRGYVYRDGEILSRDGHCRSFDAASSGTVFSSGLGIVVLRRVEDALQDSDHIRALILGSAINNDGARKVGYLAPSVEGQAEVIAEALEFAGVSADDISYVETHGTGTVVGDPIEVRALTQAFRRSTRRTGYCGIGSLKSNVGHLDAAAGVAGLIKTVLALEHAQLPPSLHFQKLNPHIEMKDSPFFVNSRLTDWHVKGSPRRAGVTSLGIGGTNAHVVLQEAPPQNRTQETTPYQLLTVSAKTEEAAARSLANLATHLRAHPELSLADAAFTCQVGRHAFSHRRAVAIENTPEAIASLARGERAQFAFGVAAKTPPPIAFMFSGQGSQYVNMGRDLYEHEPIFRETLDFCAQHLQQPLGIDLRRALFPPEQENEAAAEKLNQTWLTQPALFSIEYSLARWWMSLGITPAAMVGHSIGDYVAACLAGVFSPEDALSIVACRGRLINDLPAGAMLAVPLSAGEIPLHGALSLAAVNNPRMCVVSGPTADIAELEKSLAVQSIACRRLYTSHAFHSAMMDPILGAFEERLRGIEFQPPRIPCLSNVSGTWMTAEEATSPAYWTSQIRQTVRFSDCLRQLLRNPEQVLVECGPGNALTSLARQQGGTSAKAFQSLPHPRESAFALPCALQTIGQLWVLGSEIDWRKLHTPGSVQRVPLPTYPFERQKFWIEPDGIRPAVVSAPAPVAVPDAIGDLLYYRRTWKPALMPPASAQEPGCWIIFRDSVGVGDRMAAQLRADKQEVVLIDAGSTYRQVKRSRYLVRPGVREDYDAAIAEVIKNGLSPKKILHLWSITPDRAVTRLEDTLERSFYSPLYVTQALAAQDLTNIDLALVSNCMQQVSDEAIRSPERAVLLGLARVIPTELPGITCRAVDVDLAGPIRECALRLVAEMSSARENATIAYRSGERFIEVLEPLDLNTLPQRPRLEQSGVYLITGGLGGVGLTVAEHLAREFRARLILVGRSALPHEDQWDSALKDSRQSDAEKDKIRALLKIRSLAGGLLVAQADATNLSQMSAVVEQAQKQYGKIDGVFHAAGILDDGPLMLKSAEAAARVLDPKVRGTLVLEKLLAEARLSCFVLFSSISSILPPAGQADYAAANAFLDAFAVKHKERVVAINWGAWGDVGMAARSASPHPLLEKRLLQTPRDTVFASRLSVKKQWLVSEHRFRSGNALVPGTGYLEMAAGALASSFRGALELQDVLFLAPLTFDGAESKEVRVRLTREEQNGPSNGAFRFSVLARNGEWIEHSAGRIAPCAARPASWAGRSVVLERCKKEEIVFDESHRTKQESYFDFGPRWHCLRRLHVGRREGLAELELDDTFVGDCSRFRLHPALLDLATGCALYLTDGYEYSDDLYLPFSYKRLRSYRPIPSRISSHIRARQENLLDREVKSFDITLFDERDEVVAEIEGFAMRRIGDPSKASEKQSSGRFQGHSVDELLERADHSDIAPNEGACALTRILLAATPSSVVAVPQLLDLVNSRNAVALPQKTSAAARVESVGTTLRSWWQELLGVDQVGMDDDFFALGGHSLIGVRLVAKIKKAFQVDLELAVLFKARTVRQLAEAIHKAKQPAVAAQETWSALVPVQPNGSRIPLFCFHHVGGDVLAYEQLAKALGPDQPLYAFRSPLVSNAGIRETSVEELVTVYISELRASYPKGPYLLAGASFGGILAYEVAQQLIAQGTEPGLLLLIDSSAPGSIQNVAANEQLSTFWKDLRGKGLSYITGKTLQKTRYWQKLLREAYQYSACSAYRLGGWELPADLRYYETVHAHMRAMNRYKPQAYPGKITLMRAVKRGASALSKREDPTLGWATLAAGGLEVHDVPAADHSSILLAPYVQVMAEALKAILPVPETIASPFQPVG